MGNKQSSLVSEPLLSYVATAHPEAQPFRLFDLPDELWVRIGKMVIDDAPAMELRRVTIRPALEPNPRNKHSSKEYGIDLSPPAILQTCSALRRELRAGYYRHKVTLATSVYDDVKDGLQSLSATDKLGRWLLMIGHEARKEVQGVCHDDFARREDALTAPGFGASLKWGIGCWEFEMMLTPKRYPAAGSEASTWVHWEIKFL